MSDPVTFSTVTPVYRGADHLEQLVQALDAVRSRLESEDRPLRMVEAIFVDDASVDDSAEVMRRLEQEYAWVRVVTLSRNFGQHPATAAGILHASGDWVVTLDEDLQHHPRHVVPLLVHAASRQLDIMYARPKSAVHESAFRDWSSRTFKSGMSWISGNPNITIFNSFRVMRGAVARAAASVIAPETYLDIALGWFTQRVDSVKLELKDSRYIESGKSGYTLRSLVQHAYRMFSSSQVQALRVGAAVGIGAMVLGAVVAFVYSLVRLAGWADL
jgi:glycosyltransferase involved in cell wall biosynthesis